MSGALDNVNLHLVDSFDEVEQFFSWLGTSHEENALAFDTETTGLDPYKPGEAVRLIQIGDTMVGWAFPPEWHGAALQALREWTGDWVTHNGPFDNNWLRHDYPTQFKPVWRRQHDTMAQAHISDPTRSKALKSLAGTLIDRRASTSQVGLDRAMGDNNWNWKTVPIQRNGKATVYWLYAALDPVLTCRLHALPEFKNVRTTYREPYELEMGTLESVANMEFRGALVDLKYCDRMIETIDAYAVQVRAWAKDAYGIKNLTSLGECIAKFKELGFEFVEKTPKGDDSLNKDQLQIFAASGQWGSDLAQAILSLRRGEKFKGPYFKNFHDMVDSNNRVHPTIWSFGTRTARMSIQHPALQTLPKKDPTVRDAFIWKDGHVGISIDADQIEMRLATHFSRDEGLKEAFMSEDDFFSVVASEAYGEPVGKNDPRRSLTKNFCYGTLYGAGLEKIALTAGVPIQTMEAVMNNFHNRFPGIRKLQHEVEQLVRYRGETEGRPYVVTPTGRRMPGDKGSEYALVNYLIQSHAAEILKRGILDLELAGLGEYLILPVHDELVLEVPQEMQEDVLHTLKTTLDKVGEDYLVPLTWGPDVMVDRWGSKYRGK
jgi:DNA polymerase-1